MALAWALRDRAGDLGAGRRSSVAQLDDSLDALDNLDFTDRRARPDRRARRRRRDRPVGAVGGGVSVGRCRVIPGIGPCWTGTRSSTDMYTADPAVLVHEGYSPTWYTGHDEAPAGVDEYVMRDWLCFSSTDLRSVAVARPTARRRPLHVGPRRREGGGGRRARRSVLLVRGRRATRRCRAARSGSRSPTPRSARFLLTPSARLSSRTPCPDDTADDHTIDPSVIVR